MRNTIKKWLSEPLLHFLVIGALLFGLHTLVNNPGIESEQGRRIKVSASDIERLHEGWQRQWGRQPTEEELQWLIDEFARGEVLYREALALGLDRDDTIIRRRLVQKMEFLSKDLALLSDPIEDDLITYLEVNQEKYRIPTKVSFAHIYFSEDRRGNRAEQDARSLLSELQAEVDPPLRAPERGDAFMLQDYYPTRSQEEVEHLFGNDFAAGLFSIELGSWQGPIESSYGLHLVSVHERIESRLPELAEVRKQVRRDLRTEREQEANEKMYARLRDRYEVVVDERAITKQATNFKPVSKEGI
ncbi:MAG: peptidylprolyl isomerase [Candidatus Tectomicrobia bacterium]